MLSTASGGDPFFANVVALLHFDDVSGGVFTDVTGKTWTPHGSVAINATQPKWGIGAAQFSGGYIDTATDAGFGFGTGEYTIEGWESNNSSGDRCMFDTRGGGQGIGIYVSTTSGNFSLANNSAIIASSVSAAPGVPFYGHWAVCKDNTAGITYGYINGVMVFFIADIRTLASSSNCVIGANFINTQLFSGFMDDMRVTKGVCRYPGGTTFAVPTGPFPDSA